MLRNITLFVLLSSITLFSTAASNDSPIGARASALGNTATLLTDFWAAENNPGALGFVTQFGGGISYATPFLMQEFASKSAAFAFPIKHAAFGISVRQYGYQLYNENKVGLSYGQQLSERIALGVQLSYLNTQIGETAYGNKSAISASVGLLAKITDELNISALIVNPSRSKLSDYQDERFPTALALGLSYEFSKKVFLLGEFMKTINYKGQTKLGLEYKAMKLIYFRIGFATQPVLTSFGFGLNLNNFKIDFASSFHSTLGFSPQVSISFVPSKKK